MEAGGDLGAENPAPFDAVFDRFHWCAGRHPQIPKDKDEVSGSVEMIGYIIPNMIVSHEYPLGSVLIIFEGNQGGCVAVDDVGQVGEGEEASWENEEGYDIDA